MSEGRNEFFENMVLFFIVAGLVIAGLVYVLYWFWPYIVFYILPFIFGSLLIGGFFRIFAVTPGPQGTAHYFGLNVVYPILIFLVALIFFANPQHALIETRNGNVLGVVLDWPEVNEVYNKWRADTYENSPFKSLQRRAGQSVIYDRADIGWISLWCLFLGGPLFFWYLSRGDRESNAAAIKSKVEADTKYVRDRVQEREDKISAIIEKNVSDLKRKLTESEWIREKLEREMQVLKAKLEFSPDVPKPPEAQKSGGLLDKDIL